MSTQSFLEYWRNKVEIIETWKKGELPKELTFASSQEDYEKNGAPSAYEVAERLCDRIGVEYDRGLQQYFFNVDDFRDNPIVKQLGTTPMYQFQMRFAYREGDQAYRLVLRQDNDGITYLENWGRCEFTMGHPFQLFHKKMQIVNREEFTYHVEGGCPLSDKVLKGGRIVDSNWSRYVGHGGLRIEIQNYLGFLYPDKIEKCCRDKAKEIIDDWEV